MRTSDGLKLSWAVATTILGGAASGFGAVTMPYQAFNTPSSTAADFTPVSGGSAGATDSWTVNSGVLQHQLAANGGGSTMSGQGLATSGVAGTSFTQQVDMKFVAINTSTMRWESRLMVLADDATLPGGGATNWIAVTLSLTEPYLSGPDILSIYRNNVGGYSWDPAIGLGSSNLSSKIGTADNYRLAVSGTYAGDGSLTLTATVTDLTTAAVLATVTSSPVSSPAAGSYFGMQNTGWWGSGGTVQYSNYSLQAVPEPAAMALLGLSAAALTVRRRKVS